MAEFCLDCWKKINGEKGGDREFVLSEDLDLCEGCGEWKYVVVKKREFYDEYEFYYDCIMFPFVIFGGIIKILKRILILIFLFIKNNVTKRKRE